MTSGRYTAYHIYQNLQFPEAQKAGTWPYKAPEYQCAHSQRGALFQFDNMVERTHFDAANTTCCDQPVLNFFNKPQYSEASKPMNPSDCAARVKAPGCSVLDVVMESDHTICADNGEKLTKIRIGCASLCPEFAAVAGGGSIEGDFGQFKVIGSEPGNVMVVEYTPDPDLVRGWNEGCSGVSAITEHFCGGHQLSYLLQAGLDYPDGCGCDCCGTGSGTLPPVMYVSAPGSLQAPWSNEINLGFQVSGDESCSGGSLNGVFYGSGGSTPVSWNGSEQYHGALGIRYITRDPYQAGSSSNPACCGGYIRWSGQDACGSGHSRNTSINTQLGSSQIYSSLLTVSGNVVKVGYSFSVSGWQACSYSDSANLDVTPNCLANSPTGAVRTDSKISRYVGLLTFANNHSCSGCCGKGSVSVSFTNGCGGSDSKSYLVRRDYSDNGVIGYKYRCALSGSYYKVVRNDITCRGFSGMNTYPIGGYFYNIGDCIDSISGASAINISGAAGCNGSLTGSLYCCYYSDNGLNGTSFVSRIYSVSGSRCCEMETTGGSWVNSGASRPCCPQT